MAQDTILTVNKNSWTMITDANAAIVTFQNLSDKNMQFKATSDTTPPNSNVNGLIYEPKLGEASGDLATLFPGVTTPVRLWAKGAVNNADVYVSHA